MRFRKSFEFRFRRHTLQPLQVPSARSNYMWLCVFNTTELLVDQLLRFLLASPKCGVRRHSNQLPFPLFDHQTDAGRLLLLIVYISWFIVDDHQHFTNIQDAHSFRLAFIIWKREKERATEHLFEWIDLSLLAVDEANACNVISPVRLVRTHTCRAKEQLSPISSDRHLLLFRQAISAIALFSLCSQFTFLIRCSSIQHTFLGQLSCSFCIWYVIFWRHAHYLCCVPSSSYQSPLYLWANTPSSTSRPCLFICFKWFVLLTCFPTRRPHPIRGHLSSFPLLLKLIRLVVVLVVPLVLNWRLFLIDDCFCLLALLFFPCSGAILSLLVSSPTVIDSTLHQVLSLDSRLIIIISFRFIRYSFVILLFSSFANGCLFRHIWRPVRSFFRFVASTDCHLDCNFNALDHYSWPPFCLLIVSSSRALACAFKPVQRCWPRLPPRLLPPFKDSHLAPIAFSVCSHCDDSFNLFWVADANEAGPRNQ